MRRPVDYSATIAFCALLALVVLAFEVRQVLAGEPTISHLCQWLSASWAPLRWLALPLWAWLYYHLFWE